MLRTVGSKNMLNAEVKNVQISVVCPTYNSETYIARTMSSLVLQEEPPDEIIFCDDGSTDNTVVALEKWKQKFLDQGVDIVIKTIAHQGPGVARNRGLELARHVWVAFLDSDDAWDVAKLRRVRSEIVKNNDINFVLHWEEKRQVNGHKITLRHGQKYRPGVAISRLLYKNNIFSTSAVVCRKEVLESVGGFDPTLPNAQDYDLWLRASDLIKLIVIPEVLGFCFEEVSSITSRPYWQRYRSRIRVAWRHRRKGTVFDWLIKLGKITFSRQWLAVLR